MSFTKYNPGYLMLRYLPQLSSTLEYEQKTTSNNYPIFFHLFPVPFPFPSHHPPEFSRGFGIPWPERSVPHRPPQASASRPGVSRGRKLRCGVSRGQSWSCRRSQPGEKPGILGETMRNVSSYMITYIYGTPVEIYGNLYMEIYENQWETLGNLWEARLR